MKKIVATILIISFVITPLLLPRPAKAESFIQCSVTNGLLNIGIQILSSYVVSRVIGWLTGEVPVGDAATRAATYAQYTSYVTKEYVLDIIARCAARMLLNTMTKSITNVARTSGRDGGVVWVQNWRKFLTQAEYRGENVFRAMLSNTNVCDYMSGGMKKAFNVTKVIPLPGVNTRTGDLNSFALNANCTMPKGWSLSAYQNDFAGNGGWEAFSRLLEPNNNPYGFSLMSMDEIEKQRALEKAADATQAVSYSGQTGISGKNKSDSCKIKDFTGTGCLDYKNILTPGSYVADNLAAQAQAELSWVANVDELSEIVAAATGVLVNRLLNLASPNEGDYTVELQPTNMTYDPIPSPDTTGGGTPPSCSFTGIPIQYESYVSAAIDAAKNSGAGFLSVVPVIGGNPGQPTELAYPQGELDAVADWLVAYLRSNMPDFRGGRLYTTCLPGGNIGTDAILVGKTGDAYGEVYDFKSGVAEANGEPLINALQVSGGELTSWIRLVP